MVPVPCGNTAPVPPPSYQRALRKQPRALHCTALTLVTTFHLLDLCRLAVRLAQQRCPPPLPAGPGGAPRTYAEESLLLIALLRTLWRLSYQDIQGRRYYWNGNPVEAPPAAPASAVPRSRSGRVLLP